MGELFKSLSEKHLMRTAVVYLGGAWLLLEATGFFVDNYDLSRRLIDIVVLLLVFGFPAALIISWFHGEQGRQSVARSEASLLLTLVVLAGIGTYRISTGVEIATTGRAGAGMSTANMTFAANDLGERSIAVLPFTNSTGQDSLDWIGPGVSDMLTTNLASTGDLRVVSPQRLFELLRNAGQQETDHIPNDLAMSIASESGARRMVRGSVLGTLDDLVLDVQLIDLSDGTVIAGERVRGSDVFEMADTLAARLTSRLAVGGDDGTRLAEMPQPQRSPVALSGNSEKLREHQAELRSAWREESVDGRYRVVELLKDWQGREGEVRQALEEIVLVNPDDGESILQLVGIAGRMGDSVAVDSLIPRFLAVETDSAAALMGLGRIYERSGKLDLAREQYETLLDAGLGSTAPLDRLVRTYLREGRPRDARELLTRQATIGSDPDLEGHVRLLMADTYAWEGDFDAALAGYAEAERLAEAAGAQQTRAVAFEAALAVQWVLDPDEGASRINRSMWTLLELGRHQQAQNLIESAERMYIRDSDRLPPVDVHVLLYARARLHELQAADTGAVQAYELLLADWGDVIGRLPILADAFERLAALRGA
jgi:TolB-like protein/tetratricopeptide (TPR) repeat protein